jgi:hypothetical protein
MHELRLNLETSEGLGPQLAALGLVRQLPALATLEVTVSTQDHDDNDDDEVQWPPFTPPSLKTLRLNSDRFPGCDDPLGRSLRAALPGVLEASGARLERLEVTLPSHFTAIGDGLVHLAQALRCCSPTLKAFHLSTEDDYVKIICDGDDSAAEAERRRVGWAELLSGVSACRELQVLALPHIGIGPLFPPGTVFARLTHLQISDHEREHPPDDARGVGLWELMASGGLPALATLKVTVLGESVGAEEVRTRLAPALEAVAGTLTHLHLDCSVSDDGGEGHEFGVAVGKLRRLKDLALNLSCDGRAYHAFAQGLAASGGDRPLPLLWRVTVVALVCPNADLLASLLLPSVRVFASVHSHPPSSTSRDDRAALLLTACALRQKGYKHT